VKPATLKALRLLRSAGDRGVTTQDFLLAGVGSRYSARIFELRREFGCDIEEQRQRAGSSRYWLREEPPGLDQSAPGSAARTPREAGGGHPLSLASPGPLAADPGAGVDGDTPDREAENTASRPCVRQDTVVAVHPGAESTAVAGAGSTSPEVDPVPAPDAQLFELPEPTRSAAMHDYEEEAA